MSVEALNLLDPTSLSSAGSVGVLLWTSGVILGGYGLGSSITNVDHHLLPLAALIVAVSLLPVVVELRRVRRTGARG